MKNRGQLTIKSYHLERLAIIMAARNRKKRWYVFKKSRVSLLLLTGIVFPVLADTIRCEVIDDGIEKIKCIFETKRKAEERTTTFLWHSESHPQDDRERTIDLPANHGSVYDYRYLRGRAPGIWRVSVTLTSENGTLSRTEHYFLLEDNKIINQKE